MNIDCQTTNLPAARFPATCRLERNCLQILSVTELEMRMWVIRGVGEEILSLVLFSSGQWRSPVCATKAGKTLGICPQSGVK